MSHHKLGALVFDNIKKFCEKNWGHLGSIGDLGPSGLAQNETFCVVFKHCD